MCFWVRHDVGFWNVAREVCTFSLEICTLREIKSPNFSARALGARHTYCFLILLAGAQKQYTFLIMSAPWYGVTIRIFHIWELQSRKFRSRIRRLCSLLAYCAGVCAQKYVFLKALRCGSLKILPSKRTVCKRACSEKSSFVQSTAG